MDFHQIKTFGGALAAPPPAPLVQHKIGVLWINVKNRIKYDFQNKLK